MCSSDLRAAVLGQEIGWSLVWASLGVSVFLFVIGLFVFRRMERRFADII